MEGETWPCGWSEMCNHNHEEEATHAPEEHFHEEPFPEPKDQHVWEEVNQCFENEEGGDWDKCVKRKICKNKENKKLVCDMEKEYNMGMDDGSKCWIKDELKLNLYHNIFFRKFLKYSNLPFKTALS